MLVIFPLPLGGSLFTVTQSEVQYLWVSNFNNTTDKNALMKIILNAQSVSGKVLTNTPQVGISAHIPLKHLREELRLAQSKAQNLPIVSPCSCIMEVRSFIIWLTSSISLCGNETGLFLQNLHYLKNHCLF